MAELMHPLEYSYLKSIMLGQPFSDFQDDLCEMGWDDGMHTYNERVFTITPYSGVFDDVLQPSIEISNDGIVTFKRLDSNVVCNVESLTIDGGQQTDFSSILLTANGMSIARAQVILPKMAIFGTYIINPEDIIFKISGNVSEVCAKDITSKVFLQEEGDYTFEECNLALYEGDPSSRFFTKLLDIAMPDMGYGPLGFWNYGPVQFSAPEGLGNHAATHIALYARDQNDEWHWLIANAISRPVEFHHGIIVNFEPGDLIIQLS